jgi:tetratricopeptide (TPR) repeat protein
MFAEGVQAGQRRDYEKAIELFTNIVSRSDGYPHALLYLGRSYHALGRFNQAVLVLEFYLKIFPKSGPGHFFLGRTYLALGNLNDAVSRLRYVTEMNPGFLPALSLLGLAFLKLRRPDLAVRYFEMALEIDPENPRLATGYLNALLVKGMKLFHRGIFKEAEEIFRFINQHRPDSILSHLYLGKIYRLSGDDELSLGHYEAASSLSPGDPVFPMLKAIIFLRKGETEIAFRELNKVKHILKGLPFTQDPDLLLKFIAVTLFRNKKYREAIYYGKQVLKSDYKDEHMHAVVAESYGNLEEHEKARNHFMRSIESNKARIEYHHGLALSLWNLGDFDSLLREIRRIRRLDPKDRTAGYFEGLCMTEMGESHEKTIPRLQNLIREMGPDVNLMYALGREYLRYDMPDLSEGWFVRTLKLESGHRDSHLGLIEVYRRLGKKRKVKKAYSDYIDRFPEDKSTKNEYIKLLMDMESYSDASRELVALLSRSPHNRLLKQKLAFCYVKTESYSEAAVVYKDLLRDEPESIPLLRSLVSCLDRSGNPELAIELLERANEFMKDNPAILLPLGVLLSRNSRYDKAKEIFRAVIALYPRDWRPYQNLAVLYSRTGQEDFAARFYQTAENYRN